MINFYCGSQRPQIQHTLYIDFRKSKVLQRDNKNTLKKYAKDINPLGPIAENSQIIFVLLVHLICDEVGLVCYLHIKTMYAKFHTQGFLSRVLDILVIQVPLYTLKMVFSVFNTFSTVKTTRFIQNPFIFALRTSF